jgi:ABC-type phosphate transport system permease subunit
MWENIDKLLVLLEKHLGKTTAKIIKWFVLSIAGIAVLLWFASFVVEKLIELETNLNIHLIPSEINIPTSIFPQIGFGILWAILNIVILAGIAFIIAVFLGIIGSLLFSPFTTRRIDNVFAELLPIATRNYSITPTDESKRILDDATKLSQRWGKSKFNNFIRRTTTKKAKDKYDSTKLQVGDKQ